MVGLQVLGWRLEDLHDTFNGFKSSNKMMPSNRTNIPGNRSKSADLFLFKAFFVDTSLKGRG